MSLERTIHGWIRGAAREWETIREQMPEILDRASSESARIAVEFWHRNLWTPVLATPERAAAELHPFAPIVDRAIAEQQERLVSGVPIGLALLGLMDLGNALECVGIPLDPKSWNTMRSWLPDLQVSRDDEWVNYYWTTGFAALALGDRLVYSRFAGYVGDVPTEPDLSCVTAPRGPFPFEPGQAFQFNMQGLLHYLSGAVEQRAIFGDVVPACEDLLRSYPSLRESKSLDPGTLLWIARIVFHKIGRCPLGKVAQRLHDSAWALAGMEP